MIAERVFDDRRQVFGDGDTDWTLISVLQTARNGDYYGKPDTRAFYKWDPVVYYSGMPIHFMNREKPA